MQPLQIASQRDWSSFVQLIRRLLKLSRKLFVGRKPRGLRREMLDLKVAIRTTDILLKDMRRDYYDQGGCPCCIEDAHGGDAGDYSRLIDKNERREARLKWIEEKLASSPINKD